MILLQASRTVQLRWLALAQELCCLIQVLFFGAPLPNLGETNAIKGRPHCSSLGFCNAAICSSPDGYHWKHWHAFPHSAPSTAAPTQSTSRTSQCTIVFRFSPELDEACLSALVLIWTTSRGRKGSILAAKCNGWLFLVAIPPR
jgi:hypothetical protein